MDSTRTNEVSKTRSALLSLPQELRDHIYMYLLTATFLVENPRAIDMSSSLRLHQHKNLAILHVSKSISEEAKKVLYRHGHFRFTAFAAGSPSLHESFGSVPAIKLLQDITVRLDVRPAVSLGCDKPDFARAATTLIDQFARLDVGVQRKRCVVEVELVITLDFMLGVTETARGFKNALSRLTGFRTVEVKIGHLQLSVGGGLEGVIQWYDVLNEELAMTLGEGIASRENVHLCLMYHPRKG